MENNLLHVVLIVQFQKKYIPTPRRVIGNPRGRGVVLKAKIFKRKYEAKLEFPEGWGLKPKNPLWEGYGYFLGQHINFFVQ